MFFTVGSHDASTPQSSPMSAVVVRSAQERRGKTTGTPKPKVRLVAVALRASVGVDAPARSPPDDGGMQRRPRVVRPNERIAAKRCLQDEHLQTRGGRSG